MVRGDVIVSRGTYHDVSIARVRRPRRHLRLFRLSSAADRRRAIAGAIGENIEVPVLDEGVVGVARRKKIRARTGQEALKGCPK